MADQILPDDELTEQASAYIDGALSADERARLEADDEAMRRVGTLSSVRARLAEPAPVTAAQRDAHVAAALAAASSPMLVPVVTDLAAARTRKAKRWVPVLAAAAAVALVAGIGVTLAGRGDDSGIAATGADQAQTPLAASATTAAAATTAATAASVDRDESVGGAQKSSPAPAPEDAADTADDEVVAAAAAPLAAPVEVSSDDELTAVVDEALGLEAAPPADVNCTDHPGELLMEVSWQGIGALLFVLPSLSAPESAVVVDASSCAELITIPVP